MARNKFSPKVWCENERESNFGVFLSYCDWWWRQRWRWQSKATSLRKFYLLRLRFFFIVISLHLHEVCWIFLSIRGAIFLTNPSPSVFYSLLFHLFIERCDSKVLRSAHSLFKNKLFQKVNQWIKTYTSFYFSNFKVNSIVLMGKKGGKRPGGGDVAMVRDTNIISFFFESLRRKERKNSIFNQNRMTNTKKRKVHGITFKITEHNKSLVSNRKKSMIF